MNHHKAFIIGLLILILSIAGCATFKGQYGSIILDETARKSFESYKMDPAMNYYYSGAGAHPNAIIGLKKAYDLDNDLWKRIAPNDDLFEGLVRGMQRKANELAMTQYGFVMKDDMGQPVGIWYSVLALQTRLLKMGKGNKVVVYTPELEVYPVRVPK